MSLRSLLLATAAVCASTASFAADLPSFKAPPPPPPPAFSWTGFYIGVNAGGHWGGPLTAFSATDFPAPGGLPGGLGFLLYNGYFPLYGPSAPSGFIGGGQIGYNYQYGQFVVGLQADFNGMTGDTKLATFTGNDATVPIAIAQSINQHIDWFGTVLGRVGWTPMDRLLIYGAGGWAFGHSAMSFTQAAPGANPPFAAYASGSGNSGWAAGGGVEYAWTNNWTTKIEYLRYDLGTSTATTYFIYPAIDGVTLDSFSTMTARTHHTGNIVRAGVNYKFDWDVLGPVVAKY